jgi:pectate lyase
MLSGVSCSQAVAEGLRVAEGLTAANGPIPAFPGAEGFGVYTPGGRGGRIYLVTTLEDYGAKEPVISGSLRAAVEAKGPRIVVFRVGGNINLKRTLMISNPYLTIAGQTAPGDGICLAGQSSMVTGAHDVVLRYLRFRPGDTSQDAADAFCVYGGRDVIVDHCTANWSLDELMSTQRTKNITVQWCMISLPLDRSFHAKGAHGAGSLINGLGGISYHHNLYAHCRLRNPRVQDDVLLDFRNNVIYNWDERAGYNVQDPVRINYVGNYLKAGPNTRGRNVAFAFGEPMKAYVAGNVLEGNPDATADNWLMMKPTSLDRRTNKKPLRETVGLDQPLPTPPMTTDSAETAYQKVLDTVGASLPRRDKLDAMVVEQVRTGTGKYIDSQTDVGGWPELAGGQAPPDGDSDGMPDDWEKTNKLNPDDPADGGGDADGDGYTNIEEWINATNPRAAEPKAPAVDLAALDRQVDELLAESRRIVAASESDVDTRVKAMCQAVKPATGKPPLTPDVVAKLPA